MPRFGRITRLPQPGKVCQVENKREVDKVIHDIVGVDYKNCPAAWKEIKKRLAEDEEAFVSKLKDAMAEHAI